MRQAWYHNVQGKFEKKWFTRSWNRLSFAPHCFWGQLTFKSDDHVLIFSPACRFNPFSRYGLLGQRPNLVLRASGVRGLGDNVKGGAAAEGEGSSNMNLPFVDHQRLQRTKKKQRNTKLETIYASTRYQGCNLFWPLQISPGKKNKCPAFVFLFSIELNLIVSRV